MDIFFLQEISEKLAKSHLRMEPLLYAFRFSV